jgi:exodeoxyribonuclease VII large subunit
MANTYLTVPFKDKDTAKAMGARWDAAQRQWFVPDGRELTPFSTWLPAGAVATSNSQEVRSLLDQPGTLTIPSKKGVSLSSLLVGVSQVVAQAYKAGVWTLVEVVELRANGGHVYLGVSERDGNGAVRAKANAVIWQSTANSILSEFERATGAQLAPGIKLLVRARPVFKAQYGFSLEIDAIDPEYTLGDLEARKREIRARLQSEGVFGVNKQLQPPWDFNAVLVVAPLGGAGLGDFQAEANRLEALGVCRFTYAFSRFQGEGAAKEICDALQWALNASDSTATGPLDAIVIIRGGGAVNDLAWLNDYDLSRFVCNLPIPVMTGIGHERDNTMLDEVAHTRFDTPSKVISGIEQLIFKRVAEVKSSFEQIANIASRFAQTAKDSAGKLDMTVRAESRRHLVQGKQSTTELLAAIRIDAMQGVRSASEQSRDTVQEVKAAAMTQLAEAKRDVPAFWGQITLGATHAVRTASANGASLRASILERAQRDASRARQATEDVMDGVSSSARLVVREAAARSEALIREIAGQGPEKTLGRGFAIVRSQSGVPVTRASQVAGGAEIEIQFQDGRVAAIADKNL